MSSLGYAPIGALKVATKDIGIWKVTQRNYSRVTSAAKLTGHKKLTCISSSGFSFPIPFL